METLATNKAEIDKQRQEFAAFDLQDSDAQSMLIYIRAFLVNELWSKSSKLVQKRYATFLGHGCRDAKCGQK